MNVSAYTTVKVQRLWLNSSTERQAEGPWNIRKNISRRPNTSPDTAQNIPIGQPRGTLLRAFTPAILETIPRYLQAIYSMGY